MPEPRRPQHTLLAVGRQWLERTGTVRAAGTTEKITGILERNIFPELGGMPIADVKPRDVLQALRKVEARGTHEMAHVVKQLCSQSMRYAVACGLAERDVTVDLKGALAPVPLCCLD